MRLNSTTLKDGLLNEPLSQLSVGRGKLYKLTQQASTGLRINSAADDSAGLAISEVMRSQIRGLAQASRNAENMNQLLKTAEGALDEITSNLQRMRELSIQAANDTNDATQRGFIQNEIDALALEISRVGDQTQYNGINLLDGSTPSLVTQLGPDTTAADSITVVVQDTDATTLGVNALDVSSSTLSQAAVDSVDTALDTIAAFRSTLGVFQNRIDSAVNNNASYQGNVEQSENGIRAANIPDVIADLNAQQLMLQTANWALNRAQSLSTSLVIQMLQQ